MASPDIARTIAAIARRVKARSARAIVRVLGGHQPGEIEQHLGLLPGGVVLHLAVDHHRAGAVRHGRDDLFGEGDFGRIGREHLLGDVDLRGVQRPGADAAHQEGVAELRLAGGGVGEERTGADHRYQSSTGHWWLPHREWMRQQAIVIKTYEDTQTTSSPTGASSSPATVAERSPQSNAFHRSGSRRARRAG